MTEQRNARPQPWRAAKAPSLAELELLADARVTILSDRRKRGPYGLDGGEPGAPGRSVLITQSGERVLAGKDSIHAAAGDRIRIETPGGGGLGKESKREKPKSKKENTQ